ncbi:hypothetical protein HELRODRAFT_188039 [Helobdella robusta]|uniref:Uncharacterized protein n=1 Tax=Helobdella robusta TaxID=6412 RepID=T1FPK6_HELRO|nr:hypothetical protein HELRODRAFT_188039 [Helobdella robusta]ESO12922.1 hypothetical protein HELRODRAFT_188039 [Helobdella robusta]
MDDEKINAYRNILCMLLSTVEKDFEGREEGVKTYQWLSEWFKHSADKGFDGGFQLWKSDSLKESDELFILLRECLLSQRWKDALETMKAISLTPSYDDHYTMFRVGLEILYQLEGIGSEIVENFISLMHEKPARGIKFKEINLDCFLFKLAGQFPEGINVENFGSLIFSDAAFSLTQKFKIGGRSVGPPASANEKQNLLLSVFNVGLSLYVKWLLTRLEIDKFSMEPAMSSMEEEEKSDFVQMLNNQAKKALLSFENCKWHDGVWDCFIDKHVEILEHQAIILNDKDYILAAETILKNYSNKQPNNPNSCKFLYYFYKKHVDVFPSKNSSDALKRVCELVPSDPLVLNLVLSDVDTEDSSLYKADLLFNYLDFATCKDDEKAWFLLTDLLVKNLINDKTKLMYKSFVNTIQTCWLYRVDWWPQYHFVLSNDIVHKRRTQPNELESFVLFFSPTSMCNVIFIEKVQCFIVLSFPNDKDSTGASILYKNRRLMSPNERLK